MDKTDSDTQQSAHARLLSAAAVLFYNDGIAATGIDAIVKRAGVAKKSLYNNFASKADLVATYLEARHAEWLGLYAERLSKAKSAEDKVLAIFLAYEDHAEHEYERGFRGCGLLNAAAELGSDDPGRQVVRQHKEEVEALLTQHVSECMKGDTERASLVAQHLAFLLEGAMVRAGLERSSDCVRNARSIAAAMLESL